MRAMQYTRKQSSGFSDDGTLRETKVAKRKKAKKSSKKKK
jgi:hypothetical protein